jgi:hypothetical protein
MALTTKVVSYVSAELTKALDLVTLNAPLAKKDTTDMATGTASGLADKIFSDTRTLAASDTENLDLAGVLTDAFGDLLTFVKVKVIKVFAAVANTNNVILTIGNGGENQFIGPVDVEVNISIPPGGQLLLTAPAAGWTVTAGTGDIIVVTNGGAGTSVQYDVVIIGTSA